MTALVTQPDRGMGGLHDDFHKKEGGGVRNEGCEPAAQAFFQTVWRPRATGRDAGCRGGQGKPAAELQAMTASQVMVAVRNMQPGSFTRIRASRCVSISLQRRPETVAGFSGRRSAAPKNFSKCFQSQPFRRQNNHGSNTETTIRPMANG